MQAAKNKNPVPARLLSARWDTSPESATTNSLGVKGRTTFPRALAKAPISDGIRDHRSVENL
ncbi:hypothetical protein SynA1825c_00138 [Synechococcus sp. A18-25c]|nr:hypothetical protein SynA1825c_00138 [Synechococcus sp. A18-25c]